MIAASDPAPALRATRRLRDALQEAGVTIEGTVRLQARPATAERAGLRAGRAVVAAAGGAPCRRPSRRATTGTADTLVLTLGLEVAETGRFDDGVEVISDSVTDLPGGNAPDVPEPSLEDGSGLSPGNLVTPEAVVRVLAHAVGQPWGRKLRDALARPGEGTLAGWPRMPPIAAKTGTLRHTVALAGILDPDSDVPVVFCYLVNHDPRPGSAARREIAAALRRWRAAGAAR